MGDAQVTEARGGTAAADCGDCIAVERPEGDGGATVQVGAGLHATAPSAGPRGGLVVAVQRPSSPTVIESRGLRLSGRGGDGYDAAVRCL